MATYARSSSKSKTKKTYTEAEKAAYFAGKQDEIEKHVLQLKEGVKKVQSSAEFQAWLDFQSAFWKYSFTNTMLIWMQLDAYELPLTTKVMGAKQWIKRFNRRVEYNNFCKKSIKILAPKVKTAATKDKDNNDVFRKYITGFMLVNVYSFHQLDDQSPLPGSEGVKCGDIKGEVSAEMLSAMRKFIVDRLGYTFWHDKECEKQGALGSHRRHTKQIWISEQLTPVQTLTTLVHEAAHALDVPDISAGQAYEIGETVAEGTNYVVAQHLGLDVSTFSFPYIAGWVGDQNFDTIMALVMEKVQQFSKTILEALHNEQMETVEA